MRSYLPKKTFIIAEAGVNHNGSRELALKLIEAAAQSGADAIKFQTFKAEKLASKTLPQAAYQRLAEGKERPQQEMLKDLELPYDWHAPLQAYAKQLGLIFLSTAFDQESLAFLQTLALPLYKIPSGEITNAPLLWAFARTGQPLLLSTGMATLSEVEQALAILNHGFSRQSPPAHLDEVWRLWSQPEARELLQNKLTLLHCTSQYPTPWAEVNLAAMQSLAQAFRLPVGYSDHTQGTVIALAACAQGACVIEKHFTLDTSLPGPDHQASLAPSDFKKMVQEIRILEEALGDGIKAPQPSEWEMRGLARQSLVANQSLALGHVLTAADLATARTAGKGLSPALYWNLLGVKTQRAYEEGELILE